MHRCLIRLRKRPARDLWKKRGFFILSLELFCNVQKNCENKEAVFVDVDGNEKKTKDNINEFLELIFNHIENSAKGSFSENSFAGLFDHFDVNSNKLGATVAKRNERLAKLLNGVAGMYLSSVKDHDIDTYEYLMTMYASNAGKSGCEFFTPADVSELLPDWALSEKPPSIRCTIRSCRLSAGLEAAVGPRKSRASLRS